MWHEKDTTLEKDVQVVGDMGGHANARVRGFLHSTTRYMYLEHGCTRFCAGGGRWPGRRNEKGPKYVPNKETRYKMRAHAQRWYRTVVTTARSCTRTGPRGLVKSARDAPRVLSSAHEKRNTHENQNLDVCRALRAADPQPSVAAQACRLFRPLRARPLH